MRIMRSSQGQNDIDDEATGEQRRRGGVMDDEVLDPDLSCESDEGQFEQRDDSLVWPARNDGKALSQAYFGCWIPHLGSCAIGREH